MAKGVNEDRKVTKKDLEDSIQLMLKITAVSEAVQSQYMTMLDFLDAKGLMNEFEAYLKEHTPNRQNPAVN